MTEGASTDTAHGTHRQVLVVTYYFPPMGLSGVQRVTTFVKYLKEYGWRPTVLTIDPAGYFAYDATLLAEVQAAGVPIHRTDSWDPTRLFRRQQSVAMPSESLRSRFSAISQLLFVPDNKIGWMPHALRTGHRLLRSGSFDAIFSSAPPYTAHLVAARLSRTHHLPLVVDFRDDWVGNPRHIYATPLHRYWNERLERKVLRSSRRAVTINDAIGDALLRVGEAPVTIIPHGYDPENLTVAPAERKSGKMMFVYTGIFYDAQTPDYFLQALARVIDRHPEARDRVEAVFVGLLPKSSLQHIAALNLEDVVTYTGYESHRRAVAFQRAADVLWMTIGTRPGAEGISTSKLFEYMGSRKPILALVPPGTARRALEPYRAAMIADPEDVSAIATAISALFSQWQSGALDTPDEAYVQQHDRRHLTGMLAACLDESLQGSDIA